MHYCGFATFSEFARIAIVVLTCLKRSLESDCTYHLKPSALVQTMYRDGSYARLYDLTSLDSNIQQG